MEKIIHKADTRGIGNHGWLISHHTFSFGSYYNPERMQFGLLRVLNDDEVIGGAGFGTHPHDNMEIVSIPLSGSLEHQDTMGHSSVIYTNDVQIMSAGRGLKHSEYNHSRTEKVNFLQIWVYPKEKDIRPRYGQKTFDPKERVNKIQTVVSPDRSSVDTLWINQDAYFSLGAFDAGFESHYQMRYEEHGLYVFVIKGAVEIADEQLQKRDGIGMWDASEVAFSALEPSELLFIEIPMMSR